MGTNYPWALTATGTTIVGTSWVTQSTVGTNNKSSNPWAIKSTVDLTTPRALLQAW
jgi:hypothetical protein